MTRLWYIDGEYQSYDNLHNNEGYTTAPSVPVGYKSGSSGSWGGETSITGYHFTDGLSDEFFAASHVGWYSMDELATECQLLPEDATTFLVTNGSIQSNAASSSVSPTLILYFVQAAPQLGWMTYEEMEEAGWTEATIEPMPYAGNFTLNESMDTESVDGGFGILTKYIGEKTLNELIGWNGGGNLNIAYFSSHGVEEQQNSTIYGYSDYVMRDSGGSPIVFIDYNATYEILNAIRLGDSGNVFSSQELAWLSIDNSESNLLLNTGDDQAFPNGLEIFCLMYKKVLPPITIDLSEEII